MASISYATFVFEAKREIEVTGTTGTKSPTTEEFEGVIACRSNVASALGLTSYITSPSGKVKTIAAYKRSNALVGGIFLGSGNTAGDINVQSYNRSARKQRSAHGKGAVFTFVQTNAASDAKDKTTSHHKVTFSLPSWVAYFEANIAFSILFSKSSEILGTTGTGGLLKPHWRPKNSSGEYTLITDTAALTALATKYGIVVASTAAEEQTIESTAQG